MTTLYCGKCWETRGVAQELIHLDHAPIRDLPKPEQRDHLRARCQRSIETCPFCGTERHADKEFEITHRHFRREKGVMIDHYVTRRYQQVVDEKAVLQAA